MNVNEQTYASIKESVLCSAGVSEHRSGAAIIHVADLNLLEAFTDALPYLRAMTGCLAEISLHEEKLAVGCPDKVALAMLGCQMAGWGIPLDDEYMAIGSGPARILARKPHDVYDKLGYEEESDEAVLFLETATEPTPNALENIAMATKAKNLFVCHFAGESYFGYLSILARVLEQAVYRISHLGFDVKAIQTGNATVTPPPFQEGDPDTMYAANDAIIYTGHAELSVDDWVPALTEHCVSAASPVHGKPFKQLFQEADGDFYAIDENIYAPAKVTIHDNETGKMFEAGSIKQA